MASSTSAVSRWGAETATSTPQVSLNIHSLSGLLMRAMTRGTPNSCLESSDTTRLSSSSPVTATTTSARWGSALARSDTSQASPRSHSAPSVGAGDRDLGMARLALLHDHDLVTGRRQLGRDERADLSATHDQDPHQ